MYYFNLCKCNSNKIEKHPWKHFQLTQGQKTTLETSTAHKEEIHPTPPYTPILLRNSLTKQAGSATCLKGQRPSSAFYQGHGRKLSVSSTLCQDHTTGKLHVQIYRIFSSINLANFNPGWSSKLQNTQDAKPQRALVNKFSTFSCSRNTKEGRSTTEKEM